MGSHVFISGVSSGFGRLAALALAQRGHRVFGTMRDLHGANRPSATELVTAAQSMPGSIVVYDMELEYERSVNGAVKQILADAKHLDVVVNNAGLTTMGLAETLTAHQMLYQFDVNVVGHHRVLRAVLPSMRARRSGLLIHISDALGRVAVPLMGIYCASKAALEALADAYRYELAPLGIESTVVQPGFFPTGFVDRLEVGDDHDRAESYGPMADKLDALGDAVHELILGDDPTNPQIVADTIVTLVELTPGSRPDRFVVDGRDGSDLLRVNDAHRRAQAEMAAKLGLGDDPDPDPEPDPAA